MTAMPSLLVAAVIAVSVFAIVKFLFFALPYRVRRKALDKAYAGRAAATGRSDPVLLTGTLILAGVMLAFGAEPIAFLGGMFVGATLIQLFFHAFHAPVRPDRAAPPPSSPLKAMSYAIQDRPWRAQWVMLAYAVIVLTAVAVHALRP